MKKILSLLIAATFVVCMPVTAVAFDGPVYAPYTRCDAVLEETYTEQYPVDGGLIVTEVTEIYSYPSITRATETMKRGVKAYTLSSQYQGDLLTITLDADFYYEYGVSDSIHCPRYYSSYKVHNQEYVKEYKESKMEYTEKATYAKVKTFYEIKCKSEGVAGTAGGVTYYGPTISVDCTIKGIVSGTTTN